MPNKPGDSLDKPFNTSRSLGEALGVSELLFIAGILLLAFGVFLNFGVGWSLTVTGGVLILIAFYNALVG
ncbi:MAG: hypothetical protein J0M11_03730 [Anaerolineae bacterium]|nr:hypothetical protein [Anaerolineae bacterium]